RVTEQWIGAGDVERAGRYEHARPLDDAVRNGLLDVDVGVHGAFGFDVADGGEAVVERGARRNRGGDGAIRDRVLAQVFVVVRARDVALQEHVRVTVDETGQHGRAAQIDHSRAGRNRSAADAFDEVVLDDDGDVILDAIALAVEQMAAPDGEI